MSEPGLAHAIYCGKYTSIEKTYSKGKNVVFQRNICHSWWEGQNRKLWLRVKENGLICLACKRFGKMPENWRGVWTTVACSNLKKATKKIQYHEDSLIHRRSVEKYFRWKNNTFVLDLLKDKHLSCSEEQKAQHRKFMCTQIRAFLFILTEDLPTSTKFNQLRKYEIANGNTFLAEMYGKLNKKEQYTSQRFLQELFTATRTFLRQDVARKLSKCQFFSLEADECLDISSVEQLGIGARFLDNGCITEALLGVT